MPQLNPGPFTGKMLPSPIFIVLNKVYFLNALLLYLLCLSPPGPNHAACAIFAPLCCFPQLVLVGMRLWKQAEPQLAWGRLVRPWLSVGPFWNVSPPLISVALTRISHLKFPWSCGLNLFKSQILWRQAYSQESFLVLLGVRPAERSSLAFLEAGGCLVHPLLLAGDSDCSGGPSSYCVSCVSPVGGTLCPSLSIFHSAKSTVFTHNWLSFLFLSDRGHHRTSYF